MSIVIQRKGSTASHASVKSNASATVDPHNLEVRHRKSSVQSLDLADDHGHLSLHRMIIESQDRVSTAGDRSIDRIESTSIVNKTSHTTSSKFGLRKSVLDRIEERDEKSIVSEEKQSHYGKELNNDSI